MLLFSHKLSEEKAEENVWVYTELVTGTFGRRNYE
jgi:hypothetical protein